MGAARVRRYLAEQREALVAASGLLLAADRSGVHPTRVAVRRARSTLDTFGPCFAEGPLRQLDAALVAHGRRLAQVRDLEVLAEVLTDWWNAPGEPTPAGLRTWLTSRLDDELEQAWRAAVAGLAAADPGDLCARFDAVLATPAAGSGVRKAAARAARKADRRLAAAGGDPEDLHRARKAAKRARYAAEAVGDGDAAELHKHRQEVLGRHHDLVVASRWVAAAPVLPAVEPDARQLAVRLEAAAADCLGDL